MVTVGTDFFCVCELLIRTKLILVYRGHSHRGFEKTAAKTRDLITCIIIDLVSQFKNRITQSVSLYVIKTV